ncbi:MAG TPA: bifunctional glutamate N-acetyltransferase/amino-acid acetyltransferase ArgJ [Tepidisphaeraceae bacterium]|nr:bifunctional glutamate N-acetyltransferase/amino-acid acetyltransferase ArgJ [Tepidisphaeraceae bacterium]
MHLLTPRGFRAGAAAAGIKSKQALDVGLLICESPATSAAVFTTSRVVSPAVIIGRKHIARGTLRGVVVNSGNANACTGRQGLTDAVQMCKLAAKHLGCDPHLLLPSSTGIIGHHLPMGKIKNGIDSAYEYLGNSQEHALRFADAILTTDTRRKQAAVRVKIGGEKITIAGVCKGSGMIGPRLGLHATMLAYLTTDASISPALLRKLVQQAADGSFNAVTVDDHASTNDTACVLASGASGATIRSASDVAKFASALNEACQSLAYQIAADGEGATKVVRIDVTGASNVQAARAIARSIANSPLVKCAMNGNDPNWGRIVSAAGYAGVPFDSEKSALKLQNTLVFRRGQPVAFNAGKVSKSLAAKEVRIELACNLGKASATVWTCDLSKEYVTINADYHT